MGRNGEQRPGHRRKFYEGLIRDLVAFASYQFYWGGKQSDGASTAEHVEQAKENCFASIVITDQTFVDAPVKIDCPWELMDVWSFYTELDATRQNGMTIGPITHVEIDKWAKLNWITLLPFEVRALRAIDRSFLLHMNSKRTKDKTT